MTTGVSSLETSPALRSSGGRMHFTAANIVSTDRGQVTLDSRSPLCERDLPGAGD